MKTHLARALAGSLLAAAVHAAWAAEPVQASDAPDAPDAVVRFDIVRFEVAGNTLLSQAQIDAAVGPFTGRARDFGHVQQALEALEALYHAHGYQVVKVQLPEQELNGGVVRLVVQQIAIGKVTVTGNRHFDAANIRRSLPGLREGMTPNLDAVSASLRLANENPAKAVQLKLQSSEGGDAGKDVVDARLEVRDSSPWRLSANADNSGSGTTGRTYGGVVLQHANLFGRDHVASLQYTTTAEEPSKVAVWGAGYHIPLYAQGDSIDLFASHSNIDSGSVTAGLFNLNVVGRGSVAGARYNQILARSKGRDMRLIYGVDVKAFKNDVLFAGQNFGNDVTVRPLSVGVALAMPLDRGQTQGQANLSATLLRNVPGGSRGGQDDFSRARSGATADYTVLRFSGAYTQSVLRNWQSRLLVSGQLTGDALVPGEQFGGGGGATVRGFDERILSTDSGALVNVELYTPALCGGRWQCRLVAFVDAAHGRRHHALPGELRRASIAGAGIGARLTFGQAFGPMFNLQADFGRVLNDGGIPGAGKNKLHVRVGLAY